MPFGKLQPAMIWVAAVLWPAVLAPAQAPADPSTKGRPRPAATAPAATRPAASQPAEFPIGAETKVRDAQLGPNAVYSVWLPRNYTPDRPWPVIAVLETYSTGHENDRAWPFRQLADSRNWVIVAVDPVPRSARPGRGDIDYDQVEAEHLARVLQAVARKVRLDPRYALLASHHDNATTLRAAASAWDGWAGLALIGPTYLSTGGQRAAQAVPRGKPILLATSGASRTSGYTRAAADTLRRAGAAVTYVEFSAAPLSPSVDVKDATTRKWLLEQGPLPLARGLQAEARLLAQGGRPGRALAIWTSLRDFKEDAGVSSEAGVEAQRLTDQAARELAELDQLREQGKLMEAAAAGRRTAFRFEGTTHGQAATEKIEAIARLGRAGGPETPATQPAADLEARANALEARATAAERAGNWLEAVRLHEQYLHDYARATRYPDVARHYRQLLEDPRIKAAVRQQEADEECRNWVNLAENYLAVGKLQEALEQFRLVTTMHPDSPWADKARQRIAELSGAR